VLASDSARSKELMSTFWHILEVEPNSPAEVAGLQSNCDYIIGADSVLQESEDLFTLIEAHENKPLKLFVYNYITDSCREVTISPNSNWGGDGALGCGIGYGYLHRIPTRPVDELTNESAPLIQPERQAAAVQSLNQAPPPQSQIPQLPTESQTPPSVPLPSGPPISSQQLPPNVVSSLASSLASARIDQAVTPSLASAPPHEMPSYSMPPAPMPPYQAPVPASLPTATPTQANPAPITTTLSNFSRAGDEPRMPQVPLYPSSTGSQNYSSANQIPFNAPTSYKLPTLPGSFASQSPASMGAPLPTGSFTTPLNLPGMPPLTVSATLPSNLGLSGFQAPPYNPANSSVSGPYLPPHLQRPPFPGQMPISAGPPTSINSGSYVAQNSQI
jgi:hypothetical protein